jgi:hypothetical protein
VGTSSSRGGPLPNHLMAADRVLGVTVTGLRFCVGTESAMQSGATLRPTGIYHAVHDDEAFERTAVCGRRVLVWPHIVWPPTNETTPCDVCLDEVNRRK